MSQLECCVEDKSEIEYEISTLTNAHRNIYRTIEHLFPRWCYVDKKQLLNNLILWTERIEEVKKHWEKYPNDDQVDYPYRYIDVGKNAKEIQTFLAENPGEKHHEEFNDNHLAKSWRLCSLKLMLAVISLFTLMFLLIYSITSDLLSKAEFWKFAENYQEQKKCMEEYIALPEEDETENILEIFNNTFKLNNTLFKSFIEKFAPK